MPSALSVDSHVISVVIPALDRNSLAHCLEALSQQTRPPDEVVVVHDTERRGHSWACNEGIGRAQGDLIAFTDDDCVPPPEWLASLARALDDHDAVGAGGTLAETDPLLREIRLRRRRSRPETVQIDPGGLVGVSGNVIYRRRWLEMCAERDGYVFNETFPSAGEDWELAWRLRLYGATLVWVPISVPHLHRVTPWSHCRRQFRKGMGIACLARAHRARGAVTAAQPSLLWGGPEGYQRPRWLSAFWHKAIGPFCLRSFSTPRHFWWFWLGEKFKGAGYLWGEMRLAAGLAASRRSFCV